MSSVSKTRLSPAQYLQRERAASFKSEYYRGETFAMAGASRPHNLIVGNLIREVGNSLKDRRCEVYPSGLRVKVSPTGLYTYPDVSVVCEEPQFEDQHSDTLLNPTALFEVLSESTESYDRGVKFAQYRQLTSIREIVLVAQNRPSVESYCRQGDGTWLLRESSSLKEAILFLSLGTKIEMNEIYRNVTLDEDTDPSIPK